MFNLRQQFDSSGRDLLILVRDRSRVIVIIQIYGSAWSSCSKMLRGSALIDPAVFWAILSGHLTFVAVDLIKNVKTMQISNKRTSITSNFERHLQKTKRNVERIPLSRCPTQINAVHMSNHKPLNSFQLCSIVGAIF